MDKYTIRLAQPSDAGGVATLLRGIHWFPALESEPFAVTEQRIRLAIETHAANPSHAIYVAVDPNHQVVAYAAVHWLPYLFLQGPEGYLSELFVAESHRGLGVGKRLLNAVTLAAQDRGCSRLSLITGRQRESYQRNFYARQGFTERENMANFIRTPLKNY